MPSRNWVEQTIEQELSARYLYPSQTFNKWMIVYKMEAEKYTDQPDMIISFYSGVAQFFFSLNYSFTLMESW